MSPLSVILLTISFTSVAIYFGNNYTKFHMSREAWLVVTAVTFIVFLVKYISENIMKKKEE